MHVDGAIRTNNEAVGGTFHGPVIMGGQLGQVQIGISKEKPRIGTRLGAHDQMYSAGEWVDLAYDPVPETSGDLYEELRAAGFERWFTADGSRDMVGGSVYQEPRLPLNLVVYERHARVPRFAIELTGNADGALLYAYAATLPDLMELLAKWTPVLGALGQTEQLARSLAKQASTDG
ncbi:hypothetical protein [Streptomyces thermolilacinus]|uniref:hypothetical protein n=1 Tax=Streptomyces thermolilacinus TaxID=285540 RepID=UPI0033D03587